MKKADMLNDDKINAKLDELKDNVNEIKKTPTPKTDDKKGPSAKDITEAVANAVDGLPELAAAYQTRNFKALMQSIYIFFLYKSN